jgi:hypothetical protein
LSWDWRASEVFADTANVGFLGVVVTDALLALHRRALEALGAFGESFWEYYLPDTRVPYFNLALDATNAAAQVSTGMTTGIGGVRLIRVAPIRCLCRRSLAKP